MRTPVAPRCFKPGCIAQSAPWGFTEPGPRSQRKHPDFVLRACDEHKAEARARWEAKFSKTLRPRTREGGA